MIDLHSDPEHPADLERTMASDPLTWIPLLIDAFPSSSALDHLSCTFTAAGRYRGEPTTGIDLEGSCWERFLRCTTSDLTPWQRSADLLTRTASTFCATPLTVTNDPSTSTLDHDFETVIRDTPPATVIDSCTLLD